MMRACHLPACVLYLAIIQVQAADTLAARFSEEWRELGHELRALEDSLRKLPAIPLDDFGDDRPFLRIQSPEQARKEGELGLVIRLDWKEETPVDLIALIPARKTDSLGLDPNYGFPEDFEVSLIRPGSERMKIAEFADMSVQPALRGHPVIARP